MWLLGISERGPRTCFWDLAISHVASGCLGIPVWVAFLNTAATVSNKVILQFIKIKKKVKDSPQPVAPFSHVTPSCLLSLVYSLEPPP